MPSLDDEIKQQPQALADLAAFYGGDDGRRLLAALAAPSQLLFTGMGASYHAGWIAAQHLATLGFPAFALEAADLVYYLNGMLRPDQVVVYISQSGRSGEVAPTIRAIPDGTALVAVTNDPDSPLAHAAQVTLPLMAGEEHLVAGKTYGNTLALLWLAGRRWAGAAGEGDLAAITALGRRMQAILDSGADLAERMAAELSRVRTLVCLGHGPHAATARQCAMLMAEWARQPVLDYSIGAFRHGFIETVGPRLGALVFAPQGRTSASAEEMAAALAGRGAHVLVVSGGAVSTPARARPGEVRKADAPQSESPQGDAPQRDAYLRDPLPDEFLSPILDVVPVQLLAEALARRRLHRPGFRYIQKVVQEI